MPKESVDLIITSPPYNVGRQYTGDGADDSVAYEDYLNFSRRWLNNCYKWSRNTGRLCVNVSLDKNKTARLRFRPTSRAAMECGWRYHATIIWNEGSISR